jgi:DNA helicase-2/ATP-dependent DNA helicase PcrA
MSELTRADLDSALDLTLTDEQWHVVSSPLRPAVIVAGAGSGKTTSMSARVAWLTGSGLVRPDQVLGLTFTTKAASQLLSSMRASVQRLEAAGLLAPAIAVEDSVDGVDGVDDASPGEPIVLTYHAFAARILAEHGIRLGREPDATVLTDESRRHLAYGFVCRSSAPLGDLGRSPVVVTSHLLRLDDELTELGITPAALREFDNALAERLRGHEAESGLQVIGRTMLETAGARAALADLVTEWRAEKAVRGVVDFADQIRLAGDLVARFPEVVASVRERYATVLLDEYQDTSIAQRQLLQRIFGDGHPVLAVGDPCQAIYGWRGASVDNIESFPHHFPMEEGPADRHALSMNRRSGPAILEVANRVSERLRTVHSGVRPLSAGDNGKGAGVVSCALFETYAQEVDWLVGEILATHDSGRVPWSSIAVLAATSKDLISVDDALRLRGVPTQLVGAAALLAQPAVIELRAMLEVLHDPCANPSFVRIAAGPRWRIGARDLAALGDRAAVIAGGRRRGQHPDLAAALDEAVAGTDPTETVSLTEALEDPGDPGGYSPEAWKRFAELSAEITRLRRHVGEPLIDLLWRVMRSTGLEVEAAVASSTDGSRAVHALHTLVDLAASFADTDGRMTLGAFLSRLRDAERFDVDLEFEAPPIADAVSLITVHKAKGLEYSYVFVPFVSEKAFPGGQGRSQWTTSPMVVPWPLRPDATPVLAGFPLPDEPPRAKHHDAYLDDLRDITELENDRLAYVAFTRAESGLAVSGHWWGPHQRTPRGPARFLSAVHEACVDGLGTVVHWAPAPPDDAENPQLGSAAGPRVWPAPADSDEAARLHAVAQRVLAAPALQTALLVAPPGPPSEADVADLVIAGWDDQIAGLLEEERRRRSDDHVVRLPASVSVSTLLRAFADPVQAAIDIARPMPRPPSPAARRGTAFHAWVEARYGQQSLLDPDDLPGAADDHIVSEQALAELKRAFERTTYAGRDPLAVEAPFSIVLGGRVVNGRIDAVFAGDSAGEGGAIAEVVDWKTGSAAGVDPLQLALYRLAWAQITGIDVAQVAAAFVMVPTGEVIRPDTDSLVTLLQS